MRGRTGYGVALLILVGTASVSAWSPRRDGASGECSSTALAEVADVVAARFEDHDFIFLGSTHGGRKIHDFVVCLISRPAFQRWAPDILVEFSTAAHQELVDRYLLDLESIPAGSLRPAWFDTDRPELWATLPQIPGFFAAVRSVNEGLPPAERIRVLGGNQPVDWSGVESVEDLASYPFKTNFAAHVIVEHLASEPGAKHLVVYGEGHIHYDGGTLMSDLGAVSRDRFFVVGTVRDAESGSEEVLTPFGDPTAPFFVPVAGLPPIRAVPEDLFFVRGTDLAASIDGVLYLGPAPDEDLSGRLPLSDDDRSELRRREAISRDPRMLELRFGSREEWFREHPIEWNRGGG